MVFPLVFSVIFKFKFMGLFLLCVGVSNLHAVSLVNNFFCDFFPCSYVSKSSSQTSFLFFTNFKSNKY